MDCSDSYPSRSSSSNAKPKSRCRVELAAMTPDHIASYITTHFSGVFPLDAWGETSFFFNPTRALKRGTYFATLKFKDGDNDKASQLERDGIFRLNMGLPYKTYEALFGERPSRPSKGGVVEGDWDFTALDQLTPHPVYGWMGWVSVLNPSTHVFDECRPLLKAAFGKAKTAFEKRIIN